MKRYMLLIADGGSTTTDWCLVDTGLEDDNKRFKKFVSKGLNPYNTSLEGIRKTIIEDVLPNIELVGDRLSIYFYGAGCSTESKQNELFEIFSELFQTQNVLIEHDLLGAAKALCGDEEGICGILGTGSNSCLYDGKDVVENVRALGYVLCDEGAGTDIGKRVLTAYLRGFMPEKLSKEFAKIHPYTETEFLNNLYKGAQPNYYIASFARFAVENKEEEYTRNIIKEAFQSFFDNQVIFYTNYNKYKLNIVGSIGYLCSDILREVAESYGVEVGKFIKAPIDDLVEYHLKRI